MEDRYITFIAVVCFIIMLGSLAAGSYFLTKDSGTSASIMFDGENNIECHSVQIDRNDFLGSWYFETECKRTVLTERKSK